MSQLNFMYDELIKEYRKYIREHTAKEVAIKDLLLESSHYKSVESKMWYLDQIARIICDDNYDILVSCCCENGDGWDCGIKPY